LSKVVTERMVKSFLDLFVLDLLDNGPKHGYEIMRELKTRTGARIGAGTLYPLLYELEERKLVAGEWNSPNRRSRRTKRIQRHRPTGPVLELRVTRLSHFTGLVSTRREISAGSATTASQNLSPFP